MIALPVRHNAREAAGMERSGGPHRQPTIYDANGAPLLDVAWNVEDPTELARACVSALNAHDPLVNALRHLLTLVRQYEPTDPTQAAQDAIAALDLARK